MIAPNTPDIIDISLEFLASSSARGGSDALFVHAITVQTYNKTAIMVFILT